jgi:hypothetical protein
MKRYLIIAIALACASCVAQERAEMDAQCKSYGAKPGTDAYVNCRAQLDAAHAQAAATMMAPAPAPAIRYIYKAP